MVPNGRYTIGLLFGAESGHGQVGQTGDNATANFGAKLYRYQPPAGYEDWANPSPFGPIINGNSIGPAIVGLPAKLDGSRSADVSMSNGDITATHLTTNSGMGVNSQSLQNCGKYYFEVRAVLTHGTNDTIGIMLSYATVAQAIDGQACATVVPSGAFKGVPGNLGSTFVSGDVIGVAVDLNAQTKTEGGGIWFRKNGGVWNGNAVNDPATGVGGSPLLGYNFRLFWLPVVGFGGNGVTVGDQMAANFGQFPFANKAPGGFGVWTSALNEFVRGLTPSTASDADEQFFPPFVDTMIKNFYHPGGYVFDDETIFGPSSFGGNLPLFVDTLVVDNDEIFAPGYLAKTRTPRLRQ